MKQLILFAICAAMLLLTAFAQEGPIQLRDVDGKPHTPLQLGEEKAAVLIFISRDCPISNAFVPEMNRIAAEYGKDFAFWLVQGDADISAADAKKHAEFFAIKATVLLDPKQQLAKLTKATVTPEAVVLGAKGETLYQGRINDLYAGLTKRRQQPTTRDLRDALEAIRAGKPVTNAVAKAIGCSLSVP